MIKIEAVNKTIGGKKVVELRLISNDLPADQDKMDNLANAIVSDSPKRGFYSTLDPDVAVVQVLVED